MTKNGYILSIDQGTTSSRAALVSQDGNIICQKNIEFKQYFPKSGWVEHNPKDIISSTVECIESVIQKSGIGLNEIITAGITNQRETVVAWNKRTGEPIYNAIVWQDRRTEDICQSLRDQNYQDLIQLKTGLIIDPYYAASKIPAGVLAITVTLVPILTYAFATFLGLEKLAARRVLGILLGASAILFLVIPETSLPDRSAVIWILVACISSVCYAAENIVLAVRDLDGIGPIRMACGMSLIGTLLLGIVGLSTNNLFMISIPFNNLSWTILGLAVINVTAYTLFIYTISQSGPLFASQVGYLVTLSGIFWGIFLFGESNSIWVWASLSTMLVGLAFVTPKKSDSKRQVTK